MRIEAKKQTQLRDDKDAKTYGEEFCLIKKMEQADKTLARFVRDCGASYVMKCDGAPEQVRPHTKFQANMRKYGIKVHTDDPI